MDDIGNQAFSLEPPDPLDIQYPLGIVDAVEPLPGSSGYPTDIINPVGLDPLARVHYTQLVRLRASDSAGSTESTISTVPEYFHCTHPL